MYHPLLFGVIPFNRNDTRVMDGIENIDPDGTENKNIVNFSYSVGILQCEILVIDT